MALKDLLVYVNQLEAHSCDCVWPPIWLSARQQTNSTLRAGNELRAIGLAACLGDRARAVARSRQCGRERLAAIA